MELDTLSPSADVRLHLLWEALDGRDELIGAGIIRTDERPVISGRLLEHEPSSVMLRVRVPNLGTSFAGGPIEQRVSIPVDAVWDSEERSLARLETGVLAAGVVAGVVLIINHIVGDAVNTARRPPPLDDDDEGRMSIPIHFFGR